MSTFSPTFPPPAIRYSGPPVAASRLGPAVLLALASVPAVVLGGAPLRTLAALAALIGTAAKLDREERARLARGV